MIGEEEMVEEKRTIRLKVFRFNPVVDSEPRYETYETSWLPSLTVSMALDQINRDHRANIAFRKGCREATCGACCITVDGFPELACRGIVKDGDFIDPIQGFEVIKDLVVDRTKSTSDAFRKIKYGREGQPIGFVPAKAEEIEVSRKLTICIDCHGCNSICPPMLYTSEKFIGPMYMLNIVRSMFNPLEDYDRVTQAVDVGLYNCTLCRHCTIVCPKNIDVADGIILARRRAVEKGIISDGVKEVFENITKTDSFSGVSVDERASWAKGLNLPKKGDILLFASCHYTATEETRNILKVATVILQSLGLDVAYLHEEEPCCGAPLYLYGYEKEFGEKARKTKETLDKQGVDEILTLSPICTYAFRELYPKYAKNFDLNVKTFIEVFAEKLKAGDVKLNSVGKKAVVYHDSSHLAKFLGIVDEPRQILGSIPGVKTVEPRYYHGINAISDGYMAADKDVGLEIAKKRLEQLLDTGVNTVVTTGASDLEWLRKAAQSLGRKDVEVIDLIELIGRSIKEVRQNF